MEPPYNGHFGTSKQRTLWDLQTTDTLGPPYNGHSGTRHLVRYKEVVLSWRFKMNREIKKSDIRGDKICPLYGGSAIASFIWSVH